MKFMEWKAFRTKTGMTVRLQLIVFLLLLFTYATTENPAKKIRLDASGMPAPLLPTPISIYGAPGQFPGFPGFPSGPWTPGATGMLPPPTHIPPQFASGSVPPGSLPTGSLPPGSLPPASVSSPNSAPPGRPLFPIQNPGAPGYAPPGAPPSAFPAYATNPPQPQQQQQLQQQQMQQQQLQQQQLQQQQLQQQQLQQHQLQQLQQPTSPNQPLLQLPPHVQPPYGVPVPQQADAFLVYDDETMSVEEKRAEMERYRYDEEVLKQQMNKIDQSIEFRVSQMIGSRVGM